jgi:DMSO/TMAO reductase YedYZ molybdopterin-dependent catalytic subunit
MRTGDVGFDELQHATRNHGMPLEALRYDLTPAGLHYLLVHYDIPDVDPASYRLSVEGSATVQLSLDDLRARPRVTMPVTLECAGNGRALLSPRPVSQPWLLNAVGNAEWSGTPLAPILREAGIPEGTHDVVFTGLDHGLEGDLEQDYERALALDDALADDVFLAYEMNGQPLLPQHGAPLRLIVPGWYGMTHVKWLGRIGFVAEPYAGYQNAVSYQVRATPEDEGEPITRIAPRSMLEPPGHPEFPSGDRLLHPGPVTLAGRAWSGHGPIAGVEVTTDDGATWGAATLEAPTGPAGWTRWSLPWHATPGEHVVASRATDDTGRTQPSQATWNTGGYRNNAIQRVRVTVLPD